MKVNKINKKKMLKKSEILKELKSELAYWAGFDLTDKQVEEIYLEDEECFQHGIDTVEREDAMSILSRKITGMEWPMNGDSEEYKTKFFKELKEKSIKLGYKCRIK
jgi:hypothetical protein